MATQQNVLQNPENERYFAWTGRSLKLVGNPPAEVIYAWNALTGKVETPNRADAALEDVSKVS